MKKIVIAQHRNDKQLNDVNRFLPDIKLFFNVSSWVVSNIQCSGENALELEEKSVKGLKLNNEAFIKCYSGIFQTIWGTFEAFENSKSVFRLSIVDSSYWEFESANEEFLRYISAIYGLYVTKI